MFWFLGLMSVSILERVLGSVYVTDYGVNPLTREGAKDDVVVRAQAVELGAGRRSSGATAVFWT